MGFVPYVVLLEFLEVLCVGNRDDGFDRHQVDHLLEGVLLPLELLVRLDLEEIPTLCDVLGSWVKELWFIDPPQSRLLFSGAGCNLASLRTSKRNPFFPPHLVVAKWLANVARCSTRCPTEWRVGCLTMASSGTASILPITISAMAVTVVVIATMVALFVRYK